MRIRLSQLKRVIREEMKRGDLLEKVNPEELKVDVEAGTFTVPATPTRPEEFAAGWEAGEERELSGKLVPYKGQMLAKGDPEALPPGYSPEQMRSLSGQLSAQLKDTMTDLFGGTNLPQEQRVTKGQVVSNALAALAEKYPDDEDVVSVISTLLSINMGFDVMSPFGEEEVSEEEVVVAEVNRMISRGMRLLREGSEMRLEVLAALSMFPAARLVYVTSATARGLMNEAFDKGADELKQWVNSQIADAKNIPRQIDRAIHSLIN